MTTTQTQTQWLTELQAKLSSAGVASPDVDVIAQAYPDADPDAFLAGLEWVAQTTASGTVGNTTLPAAEPWTTIAAAMSVAPTGDLDIAFMTAIADLSVPLQSALNAAVLARAQALQAQTNKQVARKRKALSAEYIATLAELGYTFRMNQLNDMVEVCVNGTWTYISDPLAKKLRRQMRDKGFEFVNVMEDAYVAEAYDARYHPVHQYLDGLQYDGEDHIARLASYFQDEDNAFPVFLRRWLIGAVAKARGPAQNRVLVLDGAQNLGKSYFVKWLGSVLPECYIEASIDPNDKDVRIRLASKWIWEVSEFGNTTRKADREALKNFITLHNVVERKPYGMFDMVKPALASFIGTFNNESGVLNDPTGNRRFMIVGLTGINWAYSTDIDPHQVWAEANAAYLAGESWNLTQDEVALANKINERYEMDDPMDGLLKRYFRCDGTSAAWTATEEILTTLEANGLRGGSTRQNSMALGAIMTKLGNKRAKRNNANGQKVWGYVGVSHVVNVP
jgi:hypothetical protein